MHGRAIVVTHSGAISHHYATSGRWERSVPLGGCKVAPRRDSPDIVPCQFGKVTVTHPGPTLLLARGIEDLACAKGSHQRTRVPV